MHITLTDGEQITIDDRPNRRMILLKVNTVCNLKCSYCWYVINPQLHIPVKEEMTADEMQQMLDQLAPRATDVVYLSGGEAILRRDIEAVCNRLRGAGATVYMTTNGMLLDRLLGLAPLIDGYVISLDSVNSPYHDQVRGGHSITLANIPRLRQERPVCVTVVVSKQNVDQLIDIAQFCIAHQVDSLFLQLLWYPLDHPERQRRCLGREDWPRFERSLTSLQSQTHQLRLPNSGYLQLMAAAVRNGGTQGSVRGCFALEGYLSTDAHGHINHCLPYNMIRDLRSPRQASSIELGLATQGDVCQHLSEECTCLMGHFFTDLFNA